MHASCFIKFIVQNLIATKHTRFLINSFWTLWSVWITYRFIGVWKGNSGFFYLFYSSVQENQKTNPPVIVLFLISDQLLFFRFSIASHLEGSCAQLFISSGNMNSFECHFFWDAIQSFTKRFDSFQPFPVINRTWKQHKVVLCIRE